MLIVTCSTFALYASSFTKEARQGLACAESPETDLARAKRWDTLGKFETHFNHWWVRSMLVCMQILTDSIQVQGPSELRPVLRIERERVTATACRAVEQHQGGHLEPT